MGSFPLGVLRLPRKLSGTAALAAQGFNSQTNLVKSADRLQAALVWTGKMPVPLPLVYGQCWLTYGELAKLL